MIDISIIIPTYNRLSYFKVALGSALQQTHTNFEVIVTDDSTIDDIQLYVESLADPRVRFFRNVERLGISMNTRNGIIKAKGKFIAFLNDDDFWEPEFLAKTFAAAQLSEHIVCAFSDHWMVDEKGERLAARTDENSNQFRRTSLKAGVIPRCDTVALFVDNVVPLAMASLIRKDAIDVNDYPEVVGGSYDRWIVLKLVESGGDFFYCAERLTNYRIHSGMVTANHAIKLTVATVYIFEQALRRLKLTKDQRKSLGFAIRCYIRVFVKKKEVRGIRYLPKYIRSFLY